MSECVYFEKITQIFLPLYLDLDEVKHKVSGVYAGVLALLHQYSTGSADAVIVAIIVFLPA